MDAKRRRELALGALAVVLIAVAAWSLQPNTPPPGATMASNTPAGRAPGHPKNSVVEVDLKALEVERPEPEESTRNPFRFRPKPQPPPPPRPSVTKQQQEQQAAAEQFPVQPPPPPRIPLKYIGDMKDPKNPAKRIAILSDARSTYYGREGEIVDGRYRIITIGVESIELVYLDGRGRQTIRQTGQ